MRWNLTWYIPFAALCGLLCVFDTVEGYRWVRVVIAHWTWGLLLSPSAALWFSTTIASISVPLQPAIAIPALFAHGGDDYQHRYRHTFLGVSLMLASVFVCWFVAWGSFPLDNTPDGVHMRMLPFFPWPGNSFFG